MRYNHLYRDDYSIHAEWLGRICRRLSAMTEHVAFLMKDIVLFSVSFYLLRQDLARVLLATSQSHDTGARVTSR